MAANLLTSRKINRGKNPLIHSNTLKYLLTSAYLFRKCRQLLLFLAVLLNLSGFREHGIIIRIDTCTVLEGFILCGSLADFSGSAPSQ